MTEEEFAELLPWYATGTLDPDEARAVESYLAGSSAARAELESFRALHAVVQDTSGEAEWNPGMINDALARIETYERERTERAESGGLAGWLRRNLIPTWEGTPSLARAALGAQLAIMLALGAALFVGRDAEPGFQTVGGQTAPASTTARISLGFGDGVSEASARALLREIEGEIVAGPSALGLYTVALPFAPEERAPVEALLETLRADTRVRFAARAP